MSDCVDGDPPLVSVLVPAFNETPATLDESFASLRGQTFADFECIVVDDSTDPALAAACEAACDLDERFRYIHPPERLGLAAGLNLALLQARGEYVARFDSDDICHLDRLRKQVEVLRNDLEIDVLGTALEIIDEEGRPTAIRRYPTDHAGIARRMQTSNAMAHPTVMIRKGVLERFGAYNPEFRYAEDLDLWLRLLNRGVRFANLDEPLVRYRQAFTGRGGANWQFNLRARTTNFSRAFWLRRVVGLMTIAAWSLTPQRLRAPIYDVLMFRRHSKTAARL